MDLSPRPRGAESRRQLSRHLLLALATSVLALLFGVLTATADSTLGPHRATYAVDLSQRVVIDLGPLGAVHLDSPAAPLGVTVTVHEIPASPQADFLAGVGADLAAYTQLASHPRAALTPAFHALVTDALGRAAVAGGLGLILLTVLHTGDRPLQLTRRNAFALGAVVLTATSLAILPSLMRPDVLTERAEVLAGTPFEGIRLSGRLADLVNAYGPSVVAAFEENEAFYDGVAATAARAFRPAVAVAAPRSGWDIAPPRDAADLTVAVFVSDLHCNVSMARVVRALADEVGADLVFNGGDTVVSGTAAESFCVNAFAQEIDVPVVVAGGNHDSTLTADQSRGAGWHVLDGDVVEVANLRILGDTDPTFTAVGSGTRPGRDESMAAMGERLRDVACADGGLDVLLIHNPRAASATAEAGCARLTLSGHLHRTVGPEVTAAGTWRYVSSSSGGGNNGGRTIGTLQSSADLTVLRFDAGGAPVDHAVVTIAPSGAVTVSGWHALTNPSTRSVTSTSS